MNTIYYAHCIALYGTLQEARDVATLEALGFAVLNPNATVHDDAVAAIKRMGADDVMPYFLNLVGQCDALAFRALPGGKIPAGVALEIAMAIRDKKPIIELPGSMYSRQLTHAQTREYLAEVGQR